jgi:NAD(P)-dependent dehydrogenase (short-subunit alcohol dehydrogenase family)
MTNDPTRAVAGADPTAEDVLAGTDLTGRTALITGGYSGLGLATTIALARAGARVVVPARRPDVARRALTGIAEIDELDLADLGSVRAFAARFLQRYPRLDILIANAAVMAVPRTRVGPGWEAHFAVNHLGHYALANLMWPALTAAAAARVVSVTSGWDPSSRIRWDDVHFDRGYDKWAAYTQSKLANVLFARHLDQLAGPHGVHAFSASPGYIRTPLQRHLTVAEMVAAGWIDEAGTPTPGLFITPEQGAATQVWAATSPALTGHGGEYCMNCRTTGLRPADDNESARLWTLSAELTGLDLISRT